MYFEMVKTLPGPKCGNRNPYSQEKGQQSQKVFYQGDLLAEIVHYIREIRLVPTLNQD